MASKLTAGRKKVIFAFLLLFGPAFLLIFIGSRSCEHKFKQLDDYGEAVNYSIKTSTGEIITANDLSDDIVIITTLQTSCPNDCAVSFWHLDHKIYQQLRTNNKKLSKIRIVSFVTDGKGNPVEDVTPVVDMLSDNVEGYNPETWIVGTGNVKEIYDFKKNGQSLIQTGDQYYGGEGFQELMLLLDRDNHLRMVLSGKTEGMIRRMFEHVGLLKKEYDQKKAKAK